MTVANRPRLLLNRTQLRDRLSQLKGATGVSFVAVTVPDWIKYKRGAVDEKGKKIPNPYSGKILKVAEVFGQVNFVYENGVLNANMKEIVAERESLGLPALDEDSLRAEANARYDQGVSWMQPLKRDDGTLLPFCINKKDAEAMNGDGAELVPLYLWFRALRCDRVMFIDTVTAGQVAREELTPFMAESKPDAGANQGIADPEKRVKPRAYGFSGVAEINIHGECLVNSDWYNANATIRAAIEIVAGRLEIPEE